MTQLQSTSTDFIVEDMEVGDRERRSNLTIIGTEPSDAGDYGCVVMNEPGSSTEQATLLVYGKLTKQSYYVVLAQTSGLLVAGCGFYRML